MTRRWTSVYTCHDVGNMVNNRSLLGSLMECYATQWDCIMRESCANQRVKRTKLHACDMQTEGWQVAANQQAQHGSLNCKCILSTFYKQSWCKLVLCSEQATPAFWHSSQLPLERNRNSFACGKLIKNS